MSSKKSLSYIHIEADKNKQQQTELLQKNGLLQINISLLTVNIGFVTGSGLSFFGNLSSYRIGVIFGLWCW